MEALVSIRDLVVALPPGADRAHAVDGVSLDIPRNEILCIVGESGSGKSLTAHAIMDLLPRGVARQRGPDSVRRRGLCCSEPPQAMRKRRGRDIAMIFQDPMAALNPVDQYRPPGHRTDPRPSHDFAKRGAETGERVCWPEMGLKDVGGLLKSFPHQLSGGQRQRVMIADGAVAVAPAADRRRADHGAGCHHPGADPQTDQAYPGRARDERACSSPTISAWWPTWPTGWR